MYYAFALSHVSAHVLEGSYDAYFNILV